MRQAPGEIAINCKKWRSVLVLANPVTGCGRICTVSSTSKACGNVDQPVCRIDGCWIDGHTSGTQEFASLTLDLRLGDSSSTDDCPASRTKPVELCAIPPLARKKAMDGARGCILKIGP